MMLFLILNLFLATESAFSLSCEWWQTNVRSHTVDRHRRNSSEVISHQRQEHCRERWKGADTYIRNFTNNSFVGWPFNEKFKKWSKEDIQIVLESLASVPSWTEVSKYKFYRSDSSIQLGNPATSEITFGSIVLYDQFFKENDRTAILVHESGHHLYKRLLASETDEFSTLTGWKEEIRDRAVFILPPVKLIKADSQLSKDEDFSNHLEEFFKNPQKYKKELPKNYEFLQKRFPL